MNTLAVVTTTTTTIERKTGKGITAVDRAQTALALGSVAATIGTKGKVRQMTDAHQRAQLVRMLGDAIGQTKPHAPTRGVYSAAILAVLTYGADPIEWTMSIDTLEDGSVDARRADWSKLGNDLRNMAGLPGVHAARKNDPEFLALIAGIEGPVIAKARNRMGGLTPAAKRATDRLTLWAAIDEQATATRAAMLAQSVDPETMAQKLLENA